MDNINTSDYLLEHVSTVMHKQSDQLLQERLGIGLSQYKILMILREHPDLRQRLVADTLGQTEASISRQVKLLAEKGMLLVATNASSKREHCMELTGKGEKILEAAAAALQEYNNQALEQLPQKQQQQFVESLRRLHSFYCQAEKPYACDRPAWL